MNKITQVPALSSPKGNADKINAIHNRIREALRINVPEAIEAGRLLVEARDNTNHGEWLIWMQENLAFSRHTADNYVRCYKNRDRLLKVLTVSTIEVTEAYRLLAPPSEPKALPPAKLTLADINTVIQVTIHRFQSQKWPYTTEDVLGLLERLAA